MGTNCACLRSRPEPNNNNNNSNDNIKNDDTTIIEKQNNKSHDKIKAVDETKEKSDIENNGDKSSSPSPKKKKKKKKAEIPNYHLERFNEDIATKFEKQDPSADIAAIEPKFTVKKSKQLISGDLLEKMRFEFVSLNNKLLILLLNLIHFSI